MLKDNIVLYTYLKVPKHLNIKGILQLSLLGVTLGTEDSEKRWEDVRTLGDTGDLCFSVMSLANAVASVIDKVEAECQTGRLT